MQTPRVLCNATPLSEVGLHVRENLSLDKPTHQRHPLTRLQTCASPRGHSVGISNKHQHNNAHKVDTSCTPLWLSLLLHALAWQAAGTMAITMVQYPPSGYDTTELSCGMQVPHGGQALAAAWCFTALTGCYSTAWHSHSCSHKGNVLSCQENTPRPHKPPWHCL